ncbi:MAG TPA: ABC transporter substrate-binding protein [Candidatus Acidoferrum sp.]|nr:ABC transporter substrate-binding protein [Candidatus Acidoferrum sp.]
MMAVLLRAWRQVLPRLGVVLVALAMLGSPAGADEPAMPTSFVEPPLLADKVTKGELPPIQERLPKVPAVADMPWPGQTLGKHGGGITLLMATPKDTRLMVVYGYARLVAYDPKFALKPDMLQAYEVEDGRIFTFHLRPGHKWSNGDPFTTEDFRYFWEDVANNKELTPAGPPVQMLVDGEAPKVEIIDETTIRYSWSKPNPQFLAWLAGPSPLYIFRPSKYLKQFHSKYTDPKDMEQKLQKMGQHSWAALHNRIDNMYRNDNPDLPTLEPWVLVTKPPSERYVFMRNPYYYRVDAHGLQLPYIDSVAVQVADSKLIPAKIAAGDADLAARYLRFDNFTLLKQSEARGKYKVLLWNSAWGSQVALYPNLNVADPAWHELIRDVRFRRALSLAIDRSEINQVVYLGLATEGNNTVLSQSPLFDESYLTAWADFDLDKANQLLDEIGLTDRNSKNLRTLKDGRPLEIVVQTTGQSPEEGDVLELIKDTWQQIGVGLFTKPSERDRMRNDVFDGEAAMSVWTGLENGLPTPDMMPWELAPTTQQQLQWPMWGQFVETKGEAGEHVNLPEAQKLDDLLKQWSLAADTAGRTAIWREMLKIFADQAFTIGTVSGVPQPVVVSNRLHNVPEKGIYSWDPGAHFGIYKPDCFWVDDSAATTN